MASRPLSLLAAPSHCRVLIVDDSAVARAVLARAVDASDRFAVSRTVASVAAAREFLAANRVEFVLLDIEMPGTDGLTALPDLIAASAGAKILVVSSAAADGASASVQAMALGAADTLFKPAPGETSAQFARTLRERLERLADPAVERPRIAAASLMSHMERAAMPKGARDAYDIVAIGASTGGIHALSHVLRALPASFRLPILITQHLPASFMPYFAAQLAVLGGRPCEVATDRLRIRPGRIVVAPGDAHLRCAALADGSSAVRLSREAAPSGCMPSVDPMFESVAEVHRDRALGIVLSGMGRDGAIGAKALHEAGGCVVAQDEASSVVWGMPGAVAAAGIAAAQLSPAAIGDLVATRRRP